MRSPGKTQCALVALLALPLTGCYETYEPAPTAQPNVVLISIDTVRADHLSLYGYSRPTSPVLERFAEDAIVFDRYFNAGGATLPSHVTMMTGLHPRTHSVSSSTGRVLEEERLTLAEVLREDGYQTAAFVDGGWVRGKFGLAQGFDLYDDSGGMHNGRFENILPRAYEWLDLHHELPFFLFLHTYDAHSEWRQLPYECPGDRQLTFTGDLGQTFGGCRGERCASTLFSWWNVEIKEGRLASDETLTAAEIEYVKALYDGCLHYVDEKIGEILDHLRARDLYQDSLIVILSDHGEEFLEHGLLLHTRSGYEEFARVPLIVKLPRQRLGGLRVPHLGSHPDLMPTILEILGLPIPEQVQGFSLVPTFARNEPVRPNLHMYDRLRTPRWKFFRKNKELYDLQADPLETTNLYETADPELLRRLRKRVGTLLRRDRALRREFAEQVAKPPQSFELTEEEIEQLRALGYLQ